MEKASRVRSGGGLMTQNRGLFESHHPAWLVCGWFYCRIKLAQAEFGGRQDPLMLSQQLWRLLELAPAASFLTDFYRRRENDLDREAACGAYSHILDIERDCYNL